MSSRKDQKAELRAEREQREREAAAAEKRRRTIGYVVGGGLAAAAVIAIVVVLAAGGDGGSSKANSGNWPKGSVPEQKITDLAAATKAAGCQTKDPKDEGNQHLTDPNAVANYKANPPTSGTHFIDPAADGAYLTAPRKEQTVHTLEHGRVEIQFKPTVPNSVKGDLKALFDEDPYHMMIFPNQTDMPYAVAATAWDHQLVCPAYNDKVPDAIRAFKNQYRDRGPESAP
ncbi:MAG TPA: DUF3105 domain-containing protein [Gemmatimonadaceae bacterium]|nr:DUF3105 domain-containing protein [Gemmatimonadaceae bacterium]